MIVGVPKEVKSDEYRVAMLPAGVEVLTQAGHQILVQSGAGIGSGISDQDYSDHGATLVLSANEVYERSELIVKVKEPQAEEVKLLRRGQTLFTYLHLAASESLTKGLIESQCTALAYETVRGPNHSLPLLTPMSEVAGRMSVQEGAKYLERPQGGRGVLLSGLAGVQPAHILIFGGGVVGKNAARIAAGFQANVVIMDINVDRLRQLEDILPSNVTTLYSDIHNIREQLKIADLVIGGVLVPGAKAPRLVSASDLKSMKPGAVIVDVCIDQGGCFETSRPTTHSNPTYIVDNIVHYCVANMPGAVSRTSTYALCNVTFPYIYQIAVHGVRNAARQNPGIADAINLHEGQVYNSAVAQTFQLAYHEWQ